MDMIELHDRDEAYKKGFEKGIVLGKKTKDEEWKIRIEPKITELEEKHKELYDGQTTEECRIERKDMEGGCEECALIDVVRSFI